MHSKTVLLIALRPITRAVSNEASPTSQGENLNEKPRCCGQRKGKMNVGRPKVEHVKMQFG